MLLVGGARLGAPLDLSIPERTPPLFAKAHSASHAIARHPSSHPLPAILRRAILGPCVAPRHRADAMRGTLTINKGLIREKNHNARHPAFRPSHPGGVPCSAARRRRQRMRALGVR